MSGSRAEFRANPINVMTSALVVSAAASDSREPVRLRLVMKVRLTPASRTKVAKACPAITWWVLLGVLSPCSVSKICTAIIPSKASPRATSTPITRALLPPPPAAKAEGPGGSRMAPASRLGPDTTLIQISLLPD
jgi:hypothetical protein